MHKKKLYIKTFGCQMNVYDSNRMKDLMESQGYSNTSDPNSADLVIFNTCSIREKPNEKVFSEVGKFKKIRSKNEALSIHKPIIVVAGCVAKVYGKEIIKRMPIVDIVVGPESYHKLPELINRVVNNKAKEIELESPLDEKFASLPKIFGTKGVSEFLTIQEGCNKFCSYCVVPYTRGREYSRSLKEIYEEAKELVKQGVKEITLLGQNVDSYKSTDEQGNMINLAKVIKKIATIKDLERIRYMTSYPSEVNDELIETHRDEPKLMPFIHLPAQAGSDKILKAMNRRYTVKQYLDIVEKLRKARPDIAISSDFIVGFAGETDKDFEQTLDLVKNVEYAQAFSFKYSIRPNTIGEKMGDQIPEIVKSERLEKLQEILKRQQKKFNESFIGKEVDVLIEGVASKTPNTIFGKSPYLQSTEITFDTPCKNLKNYIGKILKTKITRSTTNVLYGELIK